MKTNEGFRDYHKVENGEIDAFATIDVPVTGIFASLMSITKPLRIARKGKQWFRVDDGFLLTQEPYTRAERAFLARQAIALEGAGK